MYKQDTMENKLPTIITIITNKDGVYTGDLKAYFRIIMCAPNVLHPYHGIRHMLHVLWKCYLGATTIGIDGDKLRCLLIAALFHDYDHTGTPGDDSINIERAVAGMKLHLLPEDKKQESTIEGLIRSTHYPHSGDPSTTMHAILRDVDLAQGLSDTWIELILFRLGQEKGNTVENMLEQQERFLLTLSDKFCTAWAKKYFSSAISHRLIEVREMMEVLT